MDDLKLMFADQPAVAKWIGVVTLFWSSIVLFELVK